MAETPSANIADLERSANSAGNWFYWIAGLTLVNTGMLLSGSETTFILGLGITQVVDIIAMKVAESAGDFVKWIGIAIDLAIAGIFALFGFLAAKRMVAAYVIGMVLYALDALIYLLAQEWIGVGFHVFVLFMLFGGISATRELARRGTAAPALPPAQLDGPSAPPPGGVPAV